MSLRNDTGGSTWRVAAAAAALAVAVVVVLVLVVPAVRGAGSSTAEAGAVGAHMQQVSLKDAAGRAVQLPPGGERPVLLTLGASTCEPCKRELPAVEKVYEAVDGQVAFYGVDIGDTPSAAARFFRGRGVTFPVLVDPDATMLNAIDTTGLPTTVLVSPDGVIRAVHIGSVTETSLQSLLHAKLGVRA